MTESLATPEQARLPPSPTRPPMPVESAHSTKATSSHDDFLSVTPLLASTVPHPARTRSPLPRTHARSRSLASPFPMQMTRAHSSPGLDSRGRYVYPPSLARPPSPMDKSIRRHSPLRAADDTRTLSLSCLNISETISEHAELELPQDTLSPSTELQPGYSSFSPSLHTPISRPGRRPSSSSLHSNLSSITNNTTSSNPGSVHSSPLMVSTKFNETYPGLSISSASSMPSTPTSLRSRSPSISSLETIPDIPDAEAEAEADALALEEIARLKLAAEATDADNLRRRCTADNSPSGSARGYGSRNDKRKRWSVCGAERRQDLDLETIWED